MSDLKDIKCPDCEGKLRLATFGIICERNHFFDKGSKLWQGISNSLTVRVTAENYCFCSTEKEKANCTCGGGWITKMMHETNGRQQRK